MCVKSLSQGRHILPLDTGSSLNSSGFVSGGVTSSDFDQGHLLWSVLLFLGVRVAALSYTNLSS
jgi:hypothetical protein